MNINDLMEAKRPVKKHEFETMNNSMLMATLDDYVQLMTKLSLPDYLHLQVKNGFDILEAEISKRLNK